MTADDIVRAAGAIAAAAVSIVGLSSVTVARLAPPPDAIELIAPTTLPAQAEQPWTVSDAMTDLGYQPCEHEDSNGPCFWDAASRGNGEGRSFVVVAGGAVLYLDGPFSEPCATDLECAAMHPDVVEPGHEYLDGES